MKTAHQSHLLSEEDRIAHASSLQTQAADPQSYIWVSASAGTGKTKVLTDRVLRLLLPHDGCAGTPPERILCITYTKAGASEMIDRMMKTLSEWSVCSQSDLLQHLTNLLRQDPSAKQIGQARQLFASVIETPVGLKIMTIHAFCQAVLGRFPIESGLSPHFSVIDDAEKAQYLRQALNNITHQIIENSDSDLAKAFYELAQDKHSGQIHELLNKIISDNSQLHDFYDRHGSIENCLRDLYAHLSIDPNDTIDGLYDRYFNPVHFPIDDLRRLGNLYQEGGSHNQKRVDPIKTICTLPFHEWRNNIHLYTDIFLTQAGKISAHAKPTNGLVEKYPDILERFDRLASIAFDFLSDRKTLKTAQCTAYLLRIGFAFLNAYNQIKSQNAVLDYDDLINKTRQLLGSDPKSGKTMAQWVLYKLDGGIDHVLVDEAQDTSPQQWDIILRLSEEFFAGHGNDENRNRSFFAVGDVKQSIFSFQGANPAHFESIRNALKKKADDASLLWADIPMQTSFRSTQGILDLVDNVFKDSTLNQQINLRDDIEMKHTAARTNQPCFIEIHPVIKPQPLPERTPWELPLIIKPYDDPKALLANQVADRIDHIIKNKTVLPKTQKPITAGDIMIIICRRNAFVDHLIRALKSREIPVSGVDRLVVSNHIGVQDILSVLRFALLPDDDLNLACLLKSPFLGMDDDDLIRYAPQRAGSLWHEIKDKAPDNVVFYLTHILETFHKKTAFEAVHNILSSPCALHDQTGWQALLYRLGDDVIDPVQELLAMIYHFEQKNPSTSLQGFVHMFDQSHKEIKREMDQSGGNVRIMTAHASKGLQAPVVILPDTIGKPGGGNREEGFSWSDDGYPLWASQKNDKASILEDIEDKKKTAQYAEYNRLLYVALTRAEDALLIFGAWNQKMKKTPPGSWYDSITNGYDLLPDEHKSTVSDIKIYNDGRSIDCDPERHDTNDQKPSVIIPSWAKTIIPEDQEPLRVLQPSKMDDQDMIYALSPLTANDQEKRFSRGLLIHSLLQFLPDISPDHHVNAADRFLQNKATNLPQADRKTLIDEVITIIQNKAFKPYFSRQSRAEVPISGQVTDPNTNKIIRISGQIDRLLITDHDIWIVDFKSNRPAATDVKDVPKAYKHQLRAYRMLMEQIYPDKTIHCALLWTHIPLMMEIDLDEM